MDKYIFFSIFEPCEDEGGYTIIFPDVLGCITEGDNIEDGMRNAKEALGLHIYGMEEDGDEIPQVTDAKDIELQKGQFLIPIIVYMESIRDEMEHKSVSKTVTLPRWLRNEAEKQKINFSGVLQKALKKELGIEN